MTTDIALYKVLPSIEAVYSENTRLCCISDTVKTCVTSVNDNKFDNKTTLISCPRLINLTAIKVVVFITAVLCILTNALVIVIRMKSKRNAHSVTLINLAVCDLLKGVYLAVIGGADTHYGPAYPLGEDAWKTGFICKLSGFISTVLPLVSVMSLVMIVIDRFQIVVSPLETMQRGSRVKLRSVMIFGCWAIASVPAAVLFMKSTNILTGGKAPSGVCFTGPYVMSSNPNLKLFVFAVHGIVIPIGSVFCSVIYSVLLYQHHMYKSESPFELSSDKDKSMYIRISLIIAVTLSPTFLHAIMSYVTLASVVIPFDIVDGIILIGHSVPSVLNPFLYTLGTSVMSDVYKIMKNRL